MVVLLGQVLQGGPGGFAGAVPCKNPAALLPSKATPATCMGNLQHLSPLLFSMLQCTKINAGNALPSLSSWVSLPLGNDGGFRSACCYGIQTHGNWCTALTTHQPLVPSDSLQSNQIKKCHLTLLFSIYISDRCEARSRRLPSDELQKGAERLVLRWTWEVAGEMNCLFFHTQPHSFFFFHESMVDLQCCVSFWCAAK